MVEGVGGRSEQSSGVSHRHGPLCASDDRQTTGPSIQYIYMVEEPEQWVQIGPKGAVSAAQQEVQAWQLMDGVRSQSSREACAVYINR